MPADRVITRLSTTPVKGLQLHHPDSVRLTADGAAGDRLFYLVDQDGTLQSCTRNPGLYGLYGLRATYDPESRHLEVSRGDEVLLSRTVEPAEAVGTDMWGLRTIRSDLLADPDWSDLFSDVVGRPVRLVQARRAAYDVHPVTLLGTGSVDELARRAGRTEVDARRFRMLIEFSGGDPHVEDSWCDGLLTVGEAVVRVGGPVHRCAATTRNPDTGVVDLQALREIKAYRGRQDSVFGLGSNFGVYADVVEPGRISVGDVLVPRSD